MAYSKDLFIRKIGPDLMSSERQLLSSPSVKYQYSAAASVLVALSSHLSCVHDTRRSGMRVAFRKRIDERRPSSSFLAKIHVIAH